MDFGVWSGIARAQERHNPTAKGSLSNVQAAGGLKRKWLAVNPMSKLSISSGHDIT